MKFRLLLCLEIEINWGNTFSLFSFRFCFFFFFGNTDLQRGKSGQAPKWTFGTGSVLWIVGCAKKQCYFHTQGRPWVSSQLLALSWSSPAIMAISGMNKEIAALSDSVTQINHLKYKIWSSKTIFSYFPYKITQLPLQYWLF